ncbi:MAG: DotU family type IV/VI secretion system protein [Gemmatimonadota bacterium]
MIDPTDRLSESFLLGCFEEFFSDLLRVKRAVLHDPWGIAAKGTGDADRAELRQTAAHSVRQRLQTLLEKQAAEAGRRRGEDGVGRYREAQYVMAALADEIFLHLEWEGREAWGVNLLETKLFGTQVAGERVFQRVEQLIAERDAAYREIQLIYLLALSLGFQGKYRGTSGEGLAALRQALYDLVLPRQASVVTGERRLFPQTYMHTLDRSTPIRLPTIGRWAAALAIVLTLYLAAAHIAWVDVTRDIRAVNATIAEISR